MRGIEISGRRGRGSQGETEVACLPLPGTLVAKPATVAGTGRRGGAQSIAPQRRQKPFPLSTVDSRLPLRLLVTLKPHNLRLL